MSEPKIGDSLCFVAKDNFISSGFKTVAIFIENEEDLLLIDNFFNDEQFVQAFKADSLKEAIDLANKFIEKKQVTEPAHPPIKENPPGHNSYIIDKRPNIPENRKNIKLVPQK